MQETFYIKINKTGRYLEHCGNTVGDSWYETGNVPARRYTREEALEIYELLKDRYVYEITLINTENGANEILSVFANKKMTLSKNGLPIAIRKTDTKKSIFKLSSNIFKKK